MFFCKGFRNALAKKRNRNLKRVRFHEIFIFFKIQNFSKICFLCLLHHRISMVWFLEEVDKIWHRPHAFHRKDFPKTFEKVLKVKRFPDFSFFGDHRIFGNVCSQMSIILHAQLTFWKNYIKSFYTMQNVTKQKNRKMLQNQRCRAKMLGVLFCTKFNIHHPHGMKAGASECTSRVRESSFNAFPSRWITFSSIYRFGTQFLFFIFGIPHRHLLCFQKFHLLLQIHSPDVYYRRKIIFFSAMCRFCFKCAEFHTFFCIPKMHQIWGFTLCQKAANSTRKRIAFESPLISDPPVNMFFEILLILT